MRFVRGIRIDVHQLLPTCAVSKCASLTSSGGRWLVNLVVESAGVAESRARVGGAFGLDAGVEALRSISEGARIRIVPARRAKADERRCSQRALARRGAEHVAGAAAARSVDGVCRG